MKALKTMATVNEEGQLTLDEPLLTNQNYRVEVIVLIPENDEIEDTPQEEILADFRQAWHEAMTGQVLPVEQLWDELEDV